MEVEFALNDSQRSESFWFVAKMFQLAIKDIWDRFRKKSQLVEITRKILDT